MMRIKRHDDENYFGLFEDGMTIRFAKDPTLPILPLHHPELEDICLGTLCDANCPHCYAAATREGVNFPDALDHVREHFGGLDLNDRPFQVAIGGGGEPTLHPDLPMILETFRSLEIMPNITTNGLHLSDELLSAIERFAGGVAVSCHQHLEPAWQEAIEVLKPITRASLHIIIGEPGSAERFWNIHDSQDGIDHFVALPYQALGRANHIDVIPEWDLFFQMAVEHRSEQIAFGASFFDHLQAHPDIRDEIEVITHEPEVLSGYRIMDDSFRLLRRSSMDPRPKFD